MTRTEPRQVVCVLVVVQSVTWYSPGILSGGYLSGRPCTVHFRNQSINQAINIKSIFYAPSNLI